MSDDDLVTACPNCDDTKIWARETKTPEFRCEVCGATFDEPVERRPKDPAYIAMSDPEAPSERYERVKDALRAAAADGIHHARSTRIANYAEALNARAVGQLLGKWGVAEGDVSVRTRNTSYVLWRIEVGEAVDE